MYSFPLGSESSVCFLKSLNISFAFSIPVVGKSSLLKTSFALFNHLFGLWKNKELVSVVATTVSLTTSLAVAGISSFSSTASAGPASEPISAGSVIRIASTGHTSSQALQTMQSGSRAPIAFLSEAG